MALGRTVQARESKMLYRCNGNSMEEPRESGSSVSYAKTDAMPCTKTLLVNNIPPRGVLTKQKELILGKVMPLHPPHTATCK